MAVTTLAPHLVGETAVDLRRVSKRYKTRWALQEISLRMLPGEIVGFIGPNGAGKSTLMKCIAGLITPTAGDVLVLGQRLNGPGASLHTPPGLGLCTDRIGFISYLSGIKNLRLLARIRNIATEADLREILNQVGLNPEDARPYSAYSTGMRQRLNIAQALLERPRLLLLDEPTNGLDPSGVITFRKLLSDIAAQGTAILLASHLLTELERVCHRVILVRAGRILRELSLAQDSFHRRLQLSRYADHVAAQQWLSAQGIAAQPIAAGVSIEAGPYGFDFQSQLPTPQIIRELVSKDISIEAMAPIPSFLESEYLRTVGEPGA